MGLNPEFISVFLENWHEFNESGNHESKLFLWDINTALWNAPLTSTERQVIQRLYIEPPKPPQRDKIDKNGNHWGRPAGGTTQTSLSEELGIEKSTLSNLKKSAIEKIASYLGEAYEV